MPKSIRDRILVDQRRTQRQDVSGTAARGSSGRRRPDCRCRCRQAAFASRFAARAVGGEESRRSVYIQVRRSQPLAVLQRFDAPVMETNCDRRPASTVATQALMLINSDFILQQSKLHGSTHSQGGRRKSDGPGPLGLAVSLCPKHREPKELETTALAFLAAQSAPRPLRPRPRSPPAARRQAPAAAARPSRRSMPWPACARFCSSTNEFLLDVG